LGVLYLQEKRREEEDIPTPRAERKKGEEIQKWDTAAKSHGKRRVSAGPSIVTRVGARGREEEKG